MPQAPLTLSVVIPAHNEEDSIRPVLRALCQTLEAERIPYEIVVVNDHSQDRTSEAVAEITREFPSVRCVDNRGVRRLRPGGALGAGRLHRRLRRDRDGGRLGSAGRPGPLLPPAEHGYDCVFGSRFMRGSVVVDYPRFKLAINRLANMFIKILFGIALNDTTNAFKLYRKETIEGLRPLLSHHFNLTVELPLKAIVRGYSFKVIPIGWRNRTEGVSKLRLDEMGSRYLFIVLYVWLEKHLAKGDYRRRVPPAGGTPLAGS